MEIRTNSVALCQNPLLRALSGLDLYKGEQRGDYVQCVFIACVYIHVCR